MASSTAVDGVAHAPTPSEYIIHHLGHLSTKHQDKVVDFSIINLDTVFWSVAMGIVACTLMWLAARRATSGVPGRFQAFVEIIVEMVEDQSKAIVHGNRTFIAPLALTVFIWVFLMNSLDFLPVDLFATIFSFLGFPNAYHRVVPTADLNGTMGMALGVFTLMIYYNIKIKADHWVHIGIDPLSTEHAIANTMLGQQLDHPTQEVSMISHYSSPESLCPHSATRSIPISCNP